MKKAKKKEKKKIKKMKRIEESNQQPSSLRPANDEKTEEQQEGRKKVKSKQEITIDLSQMVDKLFSNAVTILLLYNFVGLFVLHLQYFDVFYKCFGHKNP